MKKIYKWLLILYHKISNWFLLKKIKNDYYIKIGKNKFILNYQKNISDENLKNYFKENQDYLILEKTAESLIGSFKFSNHLKNSFLIFFDKTGKSHSFVHNYEKGFEPLDHFDKIFNFNMKSKYKEGFKNLFYILERI